MRSSAKKPKSVIDELKNHHDKARKASVQEILNKNRMNHLSREPATISLNTIPYQISPSISNLHLASPSTQRYPILESLQKAQEMKSYYIPQNNGLSTVPENHMYYSPLGYQLPPNYGYASPNYGFQPNNNYGFQNTQTNFAQYNNEWKENKENGARKFFTEVKKPQNTQKNNFYFQSPQISNKKRVLEYEFDRDVKNVLGSGTFSTVYLGNHVNNKSMEVAIKVVDLFKCPKSLVDEIYITKSIHNQNVVHIYDYYIDQKKGKCYLILEFCNQGSLEKKKPIPGMDLTNSPLLKTYYGYFRQILQGLKALHDLNIIHRDLKLSNILLKDEVVKISDFGFAKHMGNHSQLNSIKCGTPSTMAPEIIFENNDKVIFTKKSDIWSLGIILHELVYGIHPFQMNPDDMQKNRRIKIRKTYPLAEDFIEKALKFNIHERMSWEEAFKHPINFYDHENEFSYNRINEKKEKNQMDNIFIKEKANEKIFTNQQLKQRKTLSRVKTYSNDEMVLLILIAFLFIFLIYRWLFF